MVKWTVYPAHLDDIDALIALEREAFGPKSWGESAVADGLTAASVSTLLICEADHPIPRGFVLWRDLGSEAEILSIGVTPSSRSNGAATALLTAAFNDAKAKKIQRIFLEVDDSNLAAIALYRKFGFEQIGRRVGYYRGGADALVMRLELTSHFNAGE